jgi:inosine-uridine nucleoside N-ribohydrolase
VTTVTSAWFVDSDCGLGSPRSDVDDGFALALLLAHRVPLLAISSTYGNTSQTAAHRNIEELCKVGGCATSILRGASNPGDYMSPASVFLARQPAPVKVLALGPLTTVAGALHLNGSCVSEIVTVGGTPGAMGRWPPLFPFEFNFTKDRRATSEVFGTTVPITVVPLPVATQMQVSFADVCRIKGPFALQLELGSRRWFRRALILKASRTVPIWDLVAAFGVACPEECHFTEMRVTARQNGHVLFGAGMRTARVLASYRPADADVWASFVNAAGAMSAKGNASQGIL